MRRQTGALTRIAELRAWHNGEIDLVVRPGSDIGLLLQMIDIRGPASAREDELEPPPHMAALQEVLDAARAVADHLRDVLANLPGVVWPGGEPKPPTITRLNVAIAQLPAEPAPATRKFLDCSTGHLPHDIRDAVWNGASPFTMIGEDGEHRWVYVDDDTLSPERLEDIPLPEAAQKIVRLALNNGANVICFDPDGSEHPDLEWFEDDPEPPPLGWDSVTA